MEKIVDHLFVFEGNGVIKDFAGNYTQFRDYLNSVEKEEKKAIKAEKAEKTEEQKEKPKVQQKQKFSYKEKVEFEALPGEIEALETEKASIEEELNSGTLSAEELLEKSNRISEIIEALDEKEMRWLELSEIGG